MSVARNEELRARLAALGFRKRAGTVFTREIAEDVLGWLGLNVASEHRPPGELEINPVVGVRHQVVERVVAELRAVQYHPYLPPTVRSALGYVMPEPRYRAWMFRLDAASSDIGELIAAIADHGLPFMSSSSTLGAICEALDSGTGFADQIAYRQPVAWLLAGDRDRALDLIDVSVAELGDRADPAAEDLREFAAEFRRRAMRSPV